MIIQPYPTRHSSCGNLTEEIQLRKAPRRLPMVLWLSRCLTSLSNCLHYLRFLIDDIDIIVPSMIGQFQGSLLSACFHCLVIVIAPSTSAQFQSTICGYMFMPVVRLPSRPSWLILVLLVSAAAERGPSQGPSVGSLVLAPIVQLNTETMTHETYESAAAGSYIHDEPESTLHESACAVRSYPSTCSTEYRPCAVPKADGRSSMPGMTALLSPPFQPPSPLLPG